MHSAIPAIKVGTKVSFENFSVVFALGHFEEFTTLHNFGSKSGVISGLNQFVPDPDDTGHS